MTITEMKFEFIQSEPNRSYEIFDMHKHIYCYIRHEIETSLQRFPILMGVFNENRKEDSAIFMIHTL